MIVEVAQGVDHPWYMFTFLTILYWFTIFSIAFTLSWPARRNALAAIGFFFLAVVVSHAAFLFLVLLRTDLPVAASVSTRILGIIASATLPGVIATVGFGVALTVHTAYCKWRRTPIV